MMRLRERRRGQRERGGAWRADYLETRTVGSEEGGWKRAARAVPRQPPILLGTSVRKIGGLRQYNGSHLPSCLYEKMHVSGNSRTGNLMLNENTCTHTSTRQRDNIFSSSVEGNARTPSHVDTTILFRRMGFISPL